MPAKGIQRMKTPQLDMNPMVDMAFLLVTFFLLATTFKSADPARIVLPRSVSPAELPDNEIISISINKDGLAFIGIEDPQKRIPWLEKMAAAYQLQVTEEEKQVFSQIPGFGVPVAQLSDFLKLPQDERLRFIQPGIPRDSVANELADWVITGRVVMPRARVTIKADRKIPYKHVEQVIKMLIDNKILRFNLVTELRRLDGI
jgi:biopolymer transport protein ExbD